MAEFILSGRIVDLIVVLIALEALILIVLRRQRTRAAAISEVMNLLLPGLFLLLALRCALVEAHWSWIAAFLLLSLMCHLSDIRRRLRD